MKKTIFPALIALLSIAAVAWLQIPQLTQIKGAQQNTSPADLQREIETEKVRLNLLQKIPVFGFENLLADWVFLNFLQ